MRPEISCEELRRMLHPANIKAQGTSSDVPLAVILKSIERRFGGLDKYRAASVRLCQRGYRSVEVNDGVLTIETGLGAEQLDRILARELICNSVQGSDVADFTPGHRVLGEDGSELAECPARSG